MSKSTPQRSRFQSLLRYGGRIRHVERTLPTGAPLFMPDELQNDIKMRLNTLYEDLDKESTLIVMLVKNPNKLSQDVVNVRILQAASHIHDMKDRVDELRNLMNTSNCCIN